MQSPQTDTTGARMTSLILGPAACAAALLLCAAFISGAGTPATLVALAAVLALPYLTGFALKEHRQPAGFPNWLRTPVRHLSAALVGMMGLAVLALAEPTVLLMITGITLILGSLVLGLGRLWMNSSAHAGMMTLLGLWLAVTAHPV